MWERKRNRLIVIMCASTHGIMAERFLVVTTRGVWLFCGVCLMRQVCQRNLERKLLLALRLEIPIKTRLSPRALSVAILSCIISTARVLTRLRLLAITVVSVCLPPLPRLRPSRVTPPWSPMTMAVVS